MAKKTINRIYPNAEEKLVATTVLYVNDGVLYFDEAFEHAANTDEVQYLFLVGLTVVNAGAYYKPVHLAVADGIATVTLIGADGNKVAVKSVAVETE